MNFDDKSDFDLRMDESRSEPLSLRKTKAFTAEDGSKFRQLIHYSDEKQTFNLS